MAAFAVLGLLAGPSFGEARSRRGKAEASAAIETAKRLIRGQARDPAAVTFEGVRYLPNAVAETGKVATVVCGSFNAKNASGGYVGMQPFVYFIGSGLIVPDGDSKAQKMAASMMHESVCARN